MFRSYYKLPVAQTTQENCVSHIPSLVPVPGRDIFVQAWYQGGASLVDFTDPSNPKEIGYFDRGPINATALVLGGYWSTYWYNGAIYGSEIAPRLRLPQPHGDERHLTPSESTSPPSVKSARLNAQTQQPYHLVAEAEHPAPSAAPCRRRCRCRSGRPRSFGAFTPGVAKIYEAATDGRR